MARGRSRLTPLPTRVEHALNEGRILVLGAQVLLGFQYRGALEPGFERLSGAARALDLVALELLIVTVVVLITPAVVQQGVERGHATERVHGTATWLIDLALLPLALALGLNGFVALESVGGRAGALAAGTLAAATATAAWYGVPWAMRLSGRERAARARARREEAAMTEAKTTPLDDRIEQALMETRVVLPGVQALLGFQLAAMLMDGFERLPAVSRWIHVAGLGCVALTAILLMVPAAFHRIVEEGENTERLHRVTSGVLLVALAPLALGLAADAYVVARKVLESASAATAVAAGTAAFISGAWVGLPLLLKRRRPSRVWRVAS